MIFLDNASTTKMYEESFEVLKHYSLTEYFNPSALYSAGVNVHREIENARIYFAKILGCKEDNLIFTGSASESINLAIMGSLQSNFKHIVTSQIEHAAVYNTVKSLSQKGIKIDYLKTNIDGTVNIDSVKELVTQNTSLLCVMLVNNETGAINNIREIVKIAKSINPNIIVICDCVQAFCKIDIKLNSLGVDFAIFSAHKVHGPKGVGMLYCKNLQKLKPQILGGGQEKGYRNGTENTAGILAFKKAVEIMQNNLTENFNKVKELKDYCIKRLSEIKDIKINSYEKYSPYILNISIKNVKAEVILHMLEQFEIYVGNGSACSSKHQDNRILKSMGVGDDYVKGTIRISFSEFNTVEEVKYACEKIIECVNKLREIM